MALTKASKTLKGLRDFQLIKSTEFNYI